MNTIKKHTAGSIKISEDVIVTIAKTAACEIEGAVLKRGIKPPVRVKMPGESAAIRLDISVAEGYNAVSVAESVQHSVKSAVQNMTGFTVTKVDVNIDGVEFKNAENLNSGVGV